MSHTPIRVLLIEDNSSDVAQVRHLLREGLSSTGFELRQVPSGEGLEQVVEEFQPEVVLVDYDLPGENGIDLLERLNQVECGPRIMVTGQGHERIAAASMRSGAMDYLSKEDLTADELTKAIFRVLATASYERARLAAEMRNQHANAELELLFKSLTVPALVLDPHGGVKRINEAGIAAFGWTRTDAIGRHFHDLAHRLLPDEILDDPFSCPIRELLDQRGNGTAEGQYICRADGSFARGALRIQSIKFAGTPLGHLATFEPDSSEDVLDDESRKQGRELRDVLNVIAHVVRTPMTPILMQLSRLKKEAAGDEPIERGLGVIERNLSRMQTVFDHALEVVAVRRGHTRVRRTPTNLADVVGRAVATVSPAAEVQKVPITVAASDLWAQVDASHVQTAVERLLTSAIVRSPPVDRWKSEWMKPRTGSES